MVRAKLRLSEVTDYGGSSRKYTFNAVTDDKTPENQKFAKYTPTGKFEMMCNNPEVFPQLEAGKEYYFDISPAETK